MPLNNSRTRMNRRREFFLRPSEFFPSCFRRYSRSLKNPSLYFFQAERPER